MVMGPVLSLESWKVSFRRAGKHGRGSLAGVGWHGGYELKGVWHWGEDHAVLEDSLGL